MTHCKMVIRFRVVWMCVRYACRKKRVEIHNWSRTYGEYREHWIRKNSQQRAVSHCNIVRVCMVSSDQKGHLKMKNLILFPLFFHHFQDGSVTLVPERAIPKIAELVCVHMAAAAAAAGFSCACVRVFQ